MWHKYVEPVLQWLYHVIREPRSELDRWQRAVRFAYDLGRYGARQLREDRAPQMAAALAYQALFALVPVLVVATIIVRTLAPDQIPNMVQTVVDAAGLSAIDAPDETDSQNGLNTPPTPREGQTADPMPTDAETRSEAVTPILGDTRAEAVLMAEGPESRAEASTSPTPDDSRNASLQKWLEGQINRAASIDLGALGWINFGVIIYAAINMLVTIENSFNTIYRAPGGRSWSRRIPLYWSLLTLGPLALVMTAWLNGRVDALLTELDWNLFLVTLATTAWNVSVGWLFWMGIYSLVPNTSVNLKASAIGALVAVVLLEVGKAGLGAYVSSSTSLSLVYRSLGFIPVFMFWVYLMWLVILFGLEVSATLQFLGDHAIQEMESRRESSGLIEPSIVVSAMQVVGQDFETGRPTSQRTIAERVGVSEKLIAPIVQELCRAGYLHRVEGEQKSVCLSRAPDQIRTADLMDVGFRLADSSRESTLSAFANRLRDAQRERAANVPLAAIIPRPLNSDPAHV